uniref:Protein kinase domain-containing protein n=1 Tax=Schistosoma mansoni TaxID=6183 RepID=A0A5K4FFH1_SCHMA
MGNNISDPSIHLVKSDCLRGGFSIYKNDNYEVSFHHTVQPTYNKFRIIKYLKTHTTTHKNDDSKSDVSKYANLLACDDLLSLSIPVKLRHPSILRVHKACSDAPDSLCLVVENSVPFSAFVTNPTMDDLLAGSYSLLSALNFLHNTLGVSHNNMGTTSIFIDSNMYWKLCGFEFALEFKNMSADHIRKIEVLKGQQDAKALNFDPAYAFCYDIYCFSRMICSLTDIGVEGPFYHLAQVLINSCMHSLPKARIPSDHLLAHPSFKSPYISTLDFLDTYVSRSDKEKEVFFRSFTEKVFNRISEELFCRNILPKMFENTIFLDYPTQTLLAQIFHACEENLQESPKSKLTISLQNFQKFVNPLIVQKFMVNERHTRILLLQHFTGYLKVLTDSDLLNVILPQICRGVFDSHNTLSVLSLQALGCLANRLNSTVVLNHLRLIEENLCKSGSLSNNSNHSTSTEGNNRLVTYVWPRNNLFYEAAPKINRNNREIPLCEKKQNHVLNESSRPLAQLAVFSPNYDPSMNSCLLNCTDDLSTDSRLSNNDVLKLSNTKTEASTITSTLTTATVTAINNNIDNGNNCSQLDEAKKFQCNTENTFDVNTKFSSLVDKPVVHYSSSLSRTLVADGKSLPYYESNSDCLNNPVKISNDEREVDALLSLMEPKIVQKSIPFSPLRYSVIPDETEINRLSGLSLEQSTDEGTETNGWEDAWDTDT